MSRTAPAPALRPAVLVSILLLSASGFAQQAQLPTGQDPRLTATLSGALTSSRTGQRLEGLRLALTTLGNVVAYETTTRADGRFLFSGIRPGQYLVVVVRAGYTFPVGRMALRGGDALERTFSKGVELSGTVTDERGATVQAVTVCALRRADSGGAKRYVPVMWGRTDGRGQFLLGPGAEAPDGVYIAAVMPAGCDTVSSPDVPERLAQYPPVYAPGVTSAGDAKEIALDASAAQAVSIALKPGPTTRLEGRLVGYVNTTVVPGQIILEPPDGPVSIVRAARISADGRFAFVGLTPGSYQLIVAPKRGPDPLKWAVQSVVIAGEPIRRLLMPLHSTMALAGQDRVCGAPVDALQDAGVSHRQRPSRGRGGRRRGVPAGDVGVRGARRRLRHHRVDARRVSLECLGQRAVRLALESGVVLRARPATRRAWRRSICSMRRSRSRKARASSAL